MVEEYEAELTNLPKGALIAKTLKENNITVCSIEAGKRQFRSMLGK